MTTTVLRIEYQTQDEKARALIAILTAMGYLVEKQQVKSVTVRQLATHVGRHPASVSRSLHRLSCPPFEARRGKRRIIKLVPNADLLAYLVQYERGI